MTYTGCAINHTSFTSLGFRKEEATLKNVLKGLKAGHIVPFGAKNPKNNGQHWVAVYGYQGTNENNLKYSDFLIYDPGYNRKKVFVNVTYSACSVGWVVSSGSVLISLKSEQYL